MLRASIPLAPHPALRPVQRSRSRSISKSRHRSRLLVWAVTVNGPSLHSGRGDSLAHCGASERCDEGCEEGLGLSVKVIGGDVPWLVTVTPHLLRSQVKTRHAHRRLRLDSAGISLKMIGKKGLQRCRAGQQIAEQRANKGHRQTEFDRAVGAVLSTHRALSIILRPG